MKGPKEVLCKDLSNDEVTSPFLGRKRRKANQGYLEVDNSLFQEITCLGANMVEDIWKLFLVDRQTRFLMSIPIAT